MKKNWLIRIGLLAVVVCLMTSLMLSGTLAKYVTSDTGTDAARVAKFGVVVTADAGIFATSEGNEVEGYSVFGGEDNVLAPGTSGDVVFFTFSGTPEVAVEISFLITGAGYSADWKVSGEPEAADYFPLKFTATFVIGEVDDLINEEVDDVTVADAVSYAAFVSAINDFAREYAAGEDLSEYSLVVSWEWEFEGGNDAADTYLGDLATAPTFELGIKATVTQLDTIDIS